MSATDEKSKTASPRLAWLLHAGVVATLAVSVGIYVSSQWHRNADLIEGQGFVPAGLVHLVGLANGLHKIGVMMLASSAVLYVVLTTVLMVFVGRRWWGPLVMHGSAWTLLLVLDRLGRGSAFERCLDADLTIAREGDDTVASLTLRGKNCPDAPIDAVDVEFPTGPKRSRLSARVGRGVSDDGRLQIDLVSRADAPPTRSAYALPWCVDVRFVTESPARLCSRDAPGCTTRCDLDPARITTPAHR